ncbi:MAG: hypothetical protein ABR574_12480 [Cryomorphaceae bacterium]
MRERLESLIKDHSGKRFIEQYIRYQFFVDYSGKVYEDRFRLTRNTYTAPNYRFWLPFSGLSIIDGKYGEVGDQIKVRFKVVANDFYTKLLKILVGFAVVFTALAYYQQMGDLVFSGIWIIAMFVSIAFAYMLLTYHIT